MLRDAAVRIIGNRLGQRTDLDADIVIEMQLAQSTRLERDGKFKPWFLLSEWSQATAAAGDERVAIPSDFLMEADEFPLQIYDTASATWLDLSKKGYDYALNTYPSSGQPLLYSIGGKYFYVRPQPDVNYTVRLKYWKRAATLSTNIENDWLLYCPDLVIAVTGEVMASQYIKNEDMAQTFRNQALLAEDSLYRNHVEREETNRERVMEA